MVCTNHIPHVEQSLKEINEKANKQLALQEKQLALLESINTGIAVLYDRTPR